MVEEFLVADFCGFAGTWMASQCPHQLHLLSHFGGLDPICPLNTILSSLFTVLPLLEINLPSAINLIWVDAKIRKKEKRKSRTQDSTARANDAIVVTLAHHCSFSSHRERGQCVKETGKFSLKKGRLKIKPSEKANQIERKKWVKE